MTRIEYTNRLRAAGFRVSPQWQGRSEGGDGHLDTTCYTIHTAEGAFVTRIVVRAAGGGLDVFFESGNVRASDDIVELRRLAARRAA